MFNRCISSCDNTWLHKQLIWACPPSSELLRCGALYSKMSETIHETIQAPRNQHSSSLPCSCLHIRWSRTTGAHTLFGFNLRGICSRSRSASAGSWPLPLLAREFISKDARTNSPRVGEMLAAAAAAADEPLSGAFTAGTLCSSLPRWQLTDGSRNGTRLLAYETIRRLNGTGDTQGLISLAG